MNRFEQIDFLNQLDRERSFNKNKKTEKIVIQEVATSKQVWFLRKNNISHDHDISKKDAMKKIGQFIKDHPHKQSDKNKKSDKQVNRMKRPKASLPILSQSVSNGIILIKKDMAGIKLKRFLEAKGVSTSISMTRVEAVELIEAFDFTVDDNDSIMKNR